MFEAAGFSKQDIIHKYGLVGIPMVDTRAKFHIPSTHGDWIRIESRIESFKRSSFEVVHNVFKGEALAIEAFETRVLVGRHPDDPATAEIGSDAAGDHRAVHAGLTHILAIPA